MSLANPGIDELGASFAGSGQYASVLSSPAATESPETRGWVTEVIFEDGTARRSNARRDRPLQVSRYVRGRFCVRIEIPCLCITVLKRSLESASAADYVHGSKITRWMSNKPLKPPAAGHHYCGRHVHNSLCFWHCRRHERALRARKVDTDPERAAAVCHAGGGGRGAGGCECAGRPPQVCFTFLVFTPVKECARNASFAPFSTRWGG